MEPHWWWALVRVPVFSGTTAANHLLMEHVGNRGAQQELQEKEEVDLWQTLSNVLFPLQHPTETSEV